MSALPLKADIERHDWGGGGGLQIGGGGGHQCSGLVGSRRSRRASATSSLARIVRHRPKRSHVTTANRAAKMQSNLEAKMKRTPIRVEPISGKYFEIDSNKRSGAADVMRHPAIKRSARIATDKA